jgi:hypothetical protein
VEPGNGKTNMDLVAEKRDVAALLVLSAQLWIILLYAWYNFLKSLEKGQRDLKPYVLKNAELLGALPDTLSP